MNLLIFLLLLASISTTSIAVLAKQTYIIHTDKTKFSGNSQQFYRTLLDSVHQASFSNQETQPPQLLYVYQTAISGFSAELSPNHLETLRNVDGFISAIPDDLLTLHTTYSPHFLGLQNGKGLWNPTNLASDVIIGVLDTGIWPEHISFHDSEGISSLPARWKGDCEEGTRFSKSNCNKKLIGARVFYKGYESAAGRINETRDYRSPRDAQGHGTHTASTAAGNLVPDASLFGLAKGYASGVRYTTRIAAYKVCWALGCASSDILAAMDKAVSDGVDILSLSLGGSSRPYYSDSIAVASFGAIQNGVIVSCSAGNSGPVPSTVSNIAPWLITVAASYTDRTFPAIVQLGNGQSFEGASLYTGNPTKQLRLVYGKSAGIQGAEFCTSGTLKPNLVKGKIVLCQRGKNGRTQKGEIVKLAKGAGMILINTENEGEELFADPHILPAASLGAKAGKMVRSYLNSTKKPTAMISFKGTVFGNNAPMMAAFSSRGPSQVNPDVIKPDVTAPGVNILAAWPPTTSPSLLKTDNRSVLFNIISGTSMSCPHLSGVASLIKSVHKDWSPAAIKSALMTTAYTLNNKRATISDVASDTNSVATPFAFGSGHVDPESASDPGLIYDITTDDYLNYLCSLKYTPAQIGLFSRGRNFSCSAKTTASQAGDLNYPSFAVNFNGNVQNNVTLVYKRTVTNVGTPTSSYVVRVEEPNRVLVTVEPKILKFYKLGEKMSYTVSFVGSGTTSSDSSFGSLTWVSGKYTVRSPIAVTWL